MVEALFGRAVVGARSELDRFGRWATGFVRSSQRWLAYMREGHTCRCVVKTPQGPAVCNAQAVAPCAVCSNPVCIDHALVSHNHELCMACFEGLRLQHRSAAMPHAPRDAKKTRVYYLGVLGLKDPVDQATIHKKYKKLVVQHHPDLATTDKDRERRTKRMKAINEAYNALLRAEQPRAA